MIFKSKLPNHFDLPRRIARLGELSYNLWWVWNPLAQRLFNRVDNNLWERVNHNPILFLRQIERPIWNAAAQDANYLELYDHVFADFDAYLNRKDTWYATQYPKNPQTIAYFSMEFGLHETLPIYSGGLGVLSGDHLKESSDLGLPFVGVGLLYAEGYFSQRISEDGWQDAINNPLNFDALPLALVRNDDGTPLTFTVDFPEGAVTAQIWEVRVGRTPLYLLDTNLDINPPMVRQLTTRLYWSDINLRVMQEILLGIGGVRALRALGYTPAVWHMNEGHAAFLTLERARELVQAGKTFQEAIDETRVSNVFTTHTPVPAGNDEFPLWLVDKYLSTLWPELGLTRDQFVELARHQQSWGETFSMPVLALKFSEGRNAVSELHGVVSREMWQHLWPGRSVDEVPITYVTNGVHTSTWMARRIRALYEKYFGADWLDSLDDYEMWEKMEIIPANELWAVRNHLKRKLTLYMQERARKRWIQGGVHPVQVLASGVMLDPYVLTIGFARRFATYKRASLMMSDFDRLLEIINQPNRPVQFLFAGKAHPADEPGKMLIQEVYRKVKKAENGGRIVFLEDYDMNVARYMVQGVDIWMNTPRRPNEASGTSGMKAAINGALNFSVLDGWWREAFNGDNGWAIGPDADLGEAVQDQADADSLYETLENDIIPLYYSERDAQGVPVKWVERMKESMRTITPQFGTRRMVKEYTERLYLPAMPKKK
ncbi:MAG: alpha-glucan phosphorylase [Anaerolineae bacterium CG_4_9_14_3_um_filter_57_17]|nr:glycosyltransferase family 1 protein [bacterium]NCT19979.1 glycosyltransferase family 1 protein [bacterium]OIO84941.1 MAG: alpha-glucan phosphorylase [Anaerolineae bacterium CG2_30_57_67]PJB64075.1 MAG: alpha-glucan phosphorylase [Anaerolineae bacterium CG_4_9_14_3_um_filter_57_17]